ncbi:DUF4244 domain-containing protein [Arthrobacter alkaliphilus]|uniref:DUF4244 domain-containing protein n=1 Tax=Arthrobacter alkaliphilus TaxID=369936 RepID=UPI001F4661DF|nr:DUF4244 domain-containing protein [Arthrobacter alkaliphilus]
MSATVHTAPTPLAPVQADPPKPVARVLELFPGNKSARLPAHLHYGARRGRPGDDSAAPKQSKMRLMGSELGMATAEYAIATLAAVGFAGLLVVILRSEEVRGFLLNLIRSALSLP